jgi:serine/threonine-protein kinase
MAGCVTEDQILELLRGRVAPGAEAELHRHIDGCPDCRRLVAAAADAFFSGTLQPGAAPDGPPAEAAIAVGQRIGNYRVVRRLGAGGMGVVFEAVQEAIGRRVAIKVLHPHLVRDRELNVRLFNEARAVNLVSHPGILSIFDFGELPGGEAYLVMEYLEGTSLRDRLAAGAEGAMSGDDRLRPFRQIAAALAAAHERGIVHRDLKPDNVLIVPDPEGPGGERAKVLDFGLAKLAAAHQPAGALATRSGIVMGTPVYMAPEQCRGSGDVDERADVYALGVMLYELVAGRPPFVARGAGEIMAMHIYREPPPLGAGALPGELEALVRAMLAKDPAARPRMREVAAALERIRLDRGPAARPGTRLQRRRLSALLFAAALALGAGLLLRPGGRRPGAPPAMVLLPGGSFLMGSSGEEVEAAYEFCRRVAGERCPRALYEREQPARQVHLSPFYLDATEVTNEEFAAWLNRQPGIEVHGGRLVRQGGTLLLDLFPSYGHGGLVYQDTPQGGRFAPRAGLARKPVAQVTWDAALRYCQAQGKRLPTEAQWEFAARESQGLRFPWGDDEPRCEGVVFGRRRGEACAHLGAGPADVGATPQDRTARGIRDLGGNVSEWVQDRLIAPYPACPPPCRDPVSDAPGGGPRVFRGGNWYESAESCRAAGRGRMAPDQVKGNIGFRCAAKPE